METEVLHGIFLVLIGMGAGFVQRVSGFGMGIFAMLFLPHFMPSHTAAAASMPSPGKAKRISTATMAAIATGASATACATAGLRASLPL